MCTPCLRKRTCGTASGGGTYQYEPGTCDVQIEFDPDSNAALPFSFKPIVVSQGFLKCTGSPGGPYPANWQHFTELDDEGPTTFRGAVDEHTSTLNAHAKKYLFVGGPTYDVRWDDTVPAGPTSDKDAR